MPNNTKNNGWTSVLNSVKTPLGFFTLITLILDGTLLGTAALTEKVSMWAPIGLLGLLIVCVSAIVLIDPRALYHPKDWPPVQEKPVMVILIFPIEAIQVDLDVEQCTLEVRDETGHRKPIRAPTLAFGPGGWYFQLKDVEPSDSVRLELIEHNGRKWRIKPFAPYETTVKAFQPD